MALRITPSSGPGVPASAGLQRQAGGPLNGGAGVSSFPRRPRLLDLFCGAGGAAMGYARAGFEVVGVDIKPQPHYPFEFVRDDALEVLKILATGYPLFSPDAIHASPPCQAFTNARTIHGVGAHLDLLTPTRTLLQATGLPWVIENVPGAPMRADVILCGSQFGLEDPGVGGLVRHRLFEFSDPPMHLLPPCTHSKATISVFGHGGHIYHGVASWRRAMGIDWMTRDELSQAIPSAYTEWIGHQLITALEVAA
jgi:DNA (cytosine-5)-methyltransferase 1